MFQAYEKQLAQQAQQLSTEKEIASSKLREEVAALKIELTAKDAMIVEAKQAIKADMDRVVSKLKDQLADVEAEKDEALEKAAAVAEDSVSRAEVKKLEKEIKKKDARIKKLEDVKLTKEQVLALKKMKSERLQYLSERDELKIENERLRAAAATGGNNTDKENAEVSTRSTRSSASAASAAADAQLREEKEKRRKHAEECREEGMDFAPFIVSRDGVMGKEAKNILTRLAKTLHQKWNIPFCRTSFFVKSRMSLATLRSTTHALYGERKTLEARYEQPAFFHDNSALLGYWSTSRWS